MVLAAASCDSSNSMNDMSVAIMPIGSACMPDTATATVCGPFPKYLCDWSCGHANGYCKATCAVDGDCPMGSVCVTLASGMFCQKKCTAATASTDCRASEGYICATGAGGAAPANASAPYCSAPATMCDGGM